MRNSFVTLCACLVMLLTGSVRSEVTVKPGPSTLSCFDVYEIVLEPDRAAEGNPFTDIQVRATFTPEGGSPIEVDGFCDDQEGRRFRVRFCPSIETAKYKFELTTNIASNKKYTGSFQTTKPEGMEPVIVNPERPKHFQFASSGKPFYHIGLTAYHLLDPSNDDKQIEELLDYCVRHGFNKVRFLLTGYPRDNDTRTKSEYDPTGDPWKQPNYGAPPGEMNPLPAWLGEPHHYDFTRFNVAHWQKADRAVQAMRDRGIVATCIVTIEKQGLPKEYGVLTEHEKRLYRYAVARLAAYSNVWWDLGNEHNEFRKPDWAPKMGDLVKKWDPYDRLCSAHAYADWLYGDQVWAGYIITQQYGDCSQVNQWVFKYRDIAKPYVNEEYGYEGTLDEPKHGMNADWVRKCHWSIALAGGYATYGDWTPGTAFYTGHVGHGKAPAQLRHLRETFESLPYPTMVPHNELVGEGAFCLAKEGDIYLVYIPDGKETVLRAAPATQGFKITWINPRTGRQINPRKATTEKITLRPPSPEDWAAIVKRQ
ncbi:MAG: hypothetical protein A2Z25_19965 [Planctomycetes bacterium RBG_16_55_9]|nr:MAG: hypothetical protein A2Z25_19965 [Planctomycetes bacterium RBG_16_55_9]